MIPYIVRPKKDPTSGAVAYYPQIGKTKPVTFDEIADEISQTNTVTDADIAAVLKSLQRVVLQHLRQGRSVRLGDLGSFRASIKGSPKKTAREVTAADIQRVRVCFRQGAWLTGNLLPSAPGMSFSREAVIEEEEQ